MKIEIPQENIRNYPFQLIETTQGVIVRRGVVQIKIEGEEVASIIRVVLGFTAEKGSSRDEILDYFGEAYKESVNDLLDHLLKRQLLFIGDPDAYQPSSNGESSQEIFYWNFGMQREEVEENFNKKKVVVMGLNTISRRMAEAMAESGFTNYDVVDFHALRNLTLFDNEGTLIPEKWTPKGPRPISYEAWSATMDKDALAAIVGACDYGGTDSLGDWNQFCVAEGINFLPVLLQDLVGYVGPFVVPEETACFECARTRLASHQNDLEVRQIVESYSPLGQEYNGFLPSIASVLGDIAVVELIRAFGKPFANSMFGRMVEVNLLRGNMDNRKVLKQPRCRVCSDMNRQPQISISHTPYLSTENYTR